MAVLQSILILFAGCGTFMAGMKMMSDGIESCAGGGLRRLFNKISNRRIYSYLIGAGTTCVIQASSATSVMSVSLVNSGTITLFQAFALMLGAKLGTTITGILVSLTSFKIAGFISALTLVGILMRIILKSDFLKQVGAVLTGFGLIFIGLEMMSGAFNSSVELTNACKHIFDAINFPLLLLLTSVLFTALLQSSSSTIAIYITLIGENVVTLEQGFFLVMGATIGTCITALLASIGTSDEARRAAYGQLVFSVIGAFTVGALVWIFKTPLADFLSAAHLTVKWRLSIFNVLYNLVFSLLFLPFLKPFEKFIRLIIPDKKKKAEKQKLQYVDELMLATPALAVTQLEKEIVALADLSLKNLNRAMNMIFTSDTSEIAEVNKVENRINFVEKEVTQFLVLLSSKQMGQSDSKKAGSFYHVVSDFERIGDHAQNFAELAVEMQNENIVFSEDGIEDLKNMYKKVVQMAAEARHAFITRDTSGLAAISDHEEQLDVLRDVYLGNHVERLNKKICSIESGNYYYELLNELERVGDHLINIAYSIISPVGSQAEFKQKMKNLKYEHLDR